MSLIHQRASIICESDSRSRTEWEKEVREVWEAGWGEGGVGGGAGVTWVWGW